MDGTSFLFLFSYARPCCHGSLDSEIIKLPNFLDGLN